MRRTVGAGLVVAALVGGGVRGFSQSAALAPPATLQALAQQSLSTISGELRAAGLKQTVEVVRDTWGVPHIYAQNVDDLFFAQGYVLAQDRLWQMEWWRRSREGRLSEVLGAAAVERDRQARLLKFRGPITEAEWTSYHPEGRRIFTAFAAGVNAFMRDAATNLPVEFKLTGIVPEPWTAETLLLRTPSMGDAAAELRLAMNVAKMGVAAANRAAAPDPPDDLVVPEGFDPAIVTNDVVAATRVEGQLPRPAVVDAFRDLLPRTSAALWMPVDDIKQPGSNNWVVSGAASTTGKPVVVNDPHREVSNPSLRYIVHLNAPGWNVIGSSEAPFVGVHIGHNERVAWGLTIVGTDFQDVFVEDLDPANPAQVLYNGRPENMTVVTEQIKVKNEAPRTVELRYTRHGPVFHVDATRRKAYVLRSIFTEPGTASYLGGLRLSQAKDCRDFLAQAMYWKAPSENLICGDVDGNIAWQASALTPNRRGWSGRLPVPGSGRFEWDGFRANLPKEINPSRGFVVTANHNIHPPGFTPPVMFKTTNELAFERITRLRQLFKEGQKYSLDDHKRFQHDSYSLRGATDQPAFQGWRAEDPRTERARSLVAEWNLRLDRESAAAAVYQMWRSVADPKALDHTLAAADRRPAIETGLLRAVEKLTAEQGADPAQWRWGRMHLRPFPHQIISAFDLPAVEDSGGAGSVAADGASYRQILDVSDWDKSLTVNTPGQSGQPGSPFYGNLLQTWANMDYFPMVYSRKAVDGQAKHRLVLKP